MTKPKEEPSEKKPTEALPVPVCGIVKPTHVQSLPEGYADAIRAAALELAAAEAEVERIGEEFCSNLREGMRAAGAIRDAEAKCSKTEKAAIPRVLAAINIDALSDSIGIQDGLDENRHILGTEHADATVREMPSVSALNSHDAAKKVLLASRSALDAAVELMQASDENIRAAHERVMRAQCTAAQLITKFDDVAAEGHRKAMAMLEIAQENVTNGSDDARAAWDALVESRRLFAGHLSSELARITRALS